MLLDIEGTIASISFVYQVLFPYIRKNLESYLRSTFDSIETQTDISALRDLSHSDASNGIDTCLIPDSSTEKEKLLECVIKNVVSQMDADRKTTALKALQGHIWKNGFENGELKGKFYPDALHAIQEWHQNGLQIFIYSSGSVEAQKLMFEHNEAGDLSPMICGYYDTKIGPKTESQSYFKILDSIKNATNNLQSNQVLFITDNINEALAARAAGINTALSVRPGTAKLPENHTFKTISDFIELNNYFKF